METEQEMLKIANFFLKIPNFFENRILNYDCDQVLKIRNFLFFQNRQFSFEIFRFELNKRCSCPADDSPDDMIMGSCMAQYDISMVHLNNFHQAKWEEYRYAQIGIHGLRSRFIEILVHSLSLDLGRFNDYQKIEKVAGLQQSAGRDYVILIDYNSNLLKKYEESSRGEIRPKFSISKPV